MQLNGTEVFMLLEFCCRNFKSFQEGFDFEMQPNTRLTELKYSLLKETIEDKDVKALSASVVYGPNAAGKTTLVHAMSCFKQIVLKGNIEDSEDDRVGDRVSANMSLIPFRFAGEEEPIEFDVCFTHNKTKYRYILALVVGKFLNRDFERYISKEQLYVNDTKIFDRRTNSVTELHVDGIAQVLNKGYFIGDAETHRTIMANNVSPTSLLLLTDFNSFCSKFIVSEIKDWFTNKLIVINSSDRKKFLPYLPENAGEWMVDIYINEIAKEAGIVGSDFVYTSDSETHRTKLVSVLDKTNGKIMGIDSEVIESLGTMRLIAIMPVVLTALRNGATLIMDEMDASLHPMIVMNLISLFHNDEVNKKCAQLIFNTHNPIYLNRRLLRRDEIKFVERDKTTKSSCLYALSDFKTNGDMSVRKTSDYMRNYFVNRYGAIEDIDFTDIVIEMLSNDISPLKEE